MKTEQATRLRQAREDAGFKTAAAAIERFGWKQSTYLAHENGQNGLKVASAEQYAKAFGVDSAWLLTGNGRRKRAALPDQAVEEFHPTASPGVVEFGPLSYTSIGRFDAGFSAGPGSLREPTPQPMGYFLAETQWLRALTKAAPDMLAVVRVQGDSMTPTLFDGDWVLVDKSQRRVSREGIYAMQVLDNAWVKRLSLNLREKLVRIISDNPAIPMQELPEDDLALFGRVIALVARRVP
ncbi:MAG TPA: S24 family peptidase [Terriglobales bacterium]|nr:S24 family peptidase [Terriglobales bacterium]